MPVTFFWIFLAIIALGMPIVFALGFAPMVGFLLAEKPIFLKMLFQRTFAGIHQFPLLAIPFFILTGEIMNRAGITMSLVQFANTLVGHLRGGLAHVNIVTSMLFAGISGSAVADTSAVGSILIPAMEKGRLQSKIRGRGHRRVFGYRTDHPAQSDHGGLRIHHERIRGRIVRGRNRARITGRNDADERYRGDLQAPQLPQGAATRYGA